MKAQRTPCAHCGKPLANPAQLVHKKCARYHVVTTDGVFTQMSFLDATGNVSRTLRWKAPPIDAVPEPPPPDPLPPVRPIEEYPHTPGKCAYCKKRVRNKSRLMHRRCLARVLDPPPPPKAKPLKVDYPTSRFCPECKSLDNSLFPSLKCRNCGAYTVEQAPLSAPSDLSLVKPKRTRIRGR